MSVLAIDQGTTSTRALLLEENGQSRIIKAMEHKQFYPQQGWVEHDPEELIANIQLCIDAAEGITAVGLDNQGESCLAWHADTKQAVSPVIVWQDNRTQETINKLKSEGYEDWVLERTGLPLDSYFSASKLSFIVQNTPAAKTLLDQGNLRLGTTDAFFLDRLTGKFVTDISTASRTSLMNLNTGKWDEEVCALFGVPIETLPEIVATTGDFGHVESDGHRIPVTVSIVDQQAALYGHGCRRFGDAKITFGTGAFFLVVTGDKPVQTSRQGLLPTVAWQLEGQTPVYALDGAIYNAGSAINWAKSLGLFRNFDEINSFDPPAAIDRKLAFVPALSGLACPHWDRYAAGLWIGMSLDTTPIEMVQSILEGIAFRTGEVIEAMNAHASVQNEISIDGGVSTNSYFCQFLADVLQRTIRVQAMAETTAIGTGLLASCGDRCRTVSIDSNEDGVEVDVLGKSSEMWTGVGSGDVIKYQPLIDRSEGMMRFKNAVNKAKEWL